MSSDRRQVAELIQQTQGLGLSNSIEADNTPVTCVDHRDMLLEVFCLNCNVPICTNCGLFGKHQGHRFSPIAQAYQTSSAELRAHLNKLEHRSTALRAFLSELATVRMQLMSSAETCGDQIRNSVQFLKVSLDQRMNALLKEVEDIRDSRLVLLDTQTQFVTDDVANFEKLTSLALSMLDSSSPAQYLKKHQFLSSQISSAAEGDMQLQPCVDTELPLRMNVTEQTQVINDMVLIGTAQFGNRSGAGYSSDLDKNGVMYYLGTVGAGSDDFTSPVAAGLVQVTSADWGYVDHIEKVCWQENESSVFTGGKFGAWISFTLSDGYHVKPDRYRIQHAGDCSSHVLRNWVFEGSCDELNWDVLSIHNNDTSIEEVSGGHASWEIAPASVKKPYSSFRLTNTGPNSSGGHHLMLGSLELWGSLTKE